MQFMNKKAEEEFESKLRELTLWAVKNNLLPPDYYRRELKKFLDADIPTIRKLRE